MYQRNSIELVRVKNRLFPSASCVEVLWVANGRSLLFPWSLPGDDATAKQQTHCSQWQGGYPVDSYRAKDGHSHPAVLMNHSLFKDV